MDSKKVSSSLKAIFDGFEGIVFMLDKENNMVLFNQTFLEMFSPDTCIDGNNIYSILPDDYSGQFKIKAENVLNEGTYDNFVINFRGRELYNRVSPIRDHIEITGLFVDIIDITEKFIYKDKLNYQIKFHQAITDIMSSFLHWGNDDMDECIEQALRYAGELFGVDRCNVFKIDLEKRTAGNKYQWHREGLKPDKERLQDLNIDHFPWYLNKLCDFETINISSIEQLPAEAEAEKQIFSQFCIKSVLTLPIRTKDQLLGYISFDSISGEKEWTDDHIFLLGLISEIITGVFLKQKKDRDIAKLQKLENILMNMATELINVSHSRIEASIDQMLATVGRFIKVDRVYVFLHDFYNKSTNNIHEWVADGISPEKNNLQNIPFDMLDKIIYTLENSETLIIPDIEGLPEDHELRKHFSDQGIKSLMVIPLISNVGFAHNPINNI